MYLIVNNLRVDFTMLYKLPLSLHESGNLVERLKTHLQLVLNFSRLHSITYTVLGINYRSPR